MSEPSSTSSTAPFDPELEAALEADIDAYLVALGHALEAVQSNAVIHPTEAP